MKFSLYLLNYRSTFLECPGVISNIPLTSEQLLSGKQTRSKQLYNNSAIFLKHYPSYKNGNLNVSEFARVCDMSRITIYKYLELSPK